MRSRQRAHGRRAAYVFLVLGVPAATIAAGTAIGACNDPEGEGAPRFYIPPDGPEEDAEAGDAARPPRDSAIDSSEAGDASDAEAGDASDAGPLVVRAIATGSGQQPAALVGTGDHTCVIAGPTRALYCWGANDHGQLGNGKSGSLADGGVGDGGAFVEDVATATKITIDETGLPFDSLEEVSLAAYHSCARKDDVLFCWGQRFTGAQAEPAATNPDRTAPRAIGNFDVARLGAGGPHTCALKTNGKIACFGHSTFNELGRANAMDPACTAPFFFDYNDAGPNHVCSGQLVEVTFGALPATVRVVAGETHSCALTGGKVSCWGTTANGALGRPVAGPSELNAQVVVTDPGLLTPLDGVTAIANDGARHTCALRATGVVCWGLNDVGQLASDPATVPQRPFAGPAAAGTAGAVAIGVADRVSCAVKADATVVCWGADLTALGDAGAPSSFVPIAVKGPLGVGVLDKVEAIAPGARHACALKKDGTVWCWGKNDRGQLGDGTRVDSAYPVKVVGLP
jgi:hypothetical protein